MRIDWGLALPVEESARMGEKNDPALGAHHHQPISVLIEAGDVRVRPRGSLGQPVAMPEPRRRPQRKAPIPVPVTPDSVSGKEATSSTNGFFCKQQFLTAGRWWCIIVVVAGVLDVETVRLQRRKFNTTVTESQSYQASLCVFVLTATM